MMRGREREDCEKMREGEKGAAFAEC